MPTKRIMVVRHGEKPSVDGSIQGVTEEGFADPDELSVRGWQRAGALVRFFAPLDGAQRPGIQRPEALFGPGVTQHVTSVRAPHMLGPLAKVIERPISTEFTKGQEQQLAAVIRDLPGPVLVAWEHKAICEMANFIVGNEQSTPQFWPDDRFDLVWIFEGTEQGWTFSQVPQLLLPGDRPEPIQSSL